MSHDLLTPHEQGMAAVGRFIARAQARGEAEREAAAAVEPGLVPIDYTGPPTKVEQVRARLLRGSEIDALKPKAPLVADWIDLGDFASALGSPGAGKSFVGVDLAGCVAAGIPWHGYDVTQGPVLYVAGEGAQGLPKRWAAWRAYNGLAGVDIDVLWLPMRIDFRDPEWADAAAEVAHDEGVILTIVDTLARTFGGGNENDSGDMGSYIAGIDRIREATNGTTLVVHHPGKSESAGGRGHSSLLGALDVEMTVKRRGDLVVVTSSKQKDRGEPPALTLAKIPTLDSLALGPALADAVPERVHAGGEQLERIQLIVATIAREGEVDSISVLRSLVSERSKQINGQGIAGAAVSSGVDVAIRAGCVEESTGARQARTFRYVRDFTLADLEEFLS
jgi:hypothetical protein